MKKFFVTVGFLIPFLTAVAGDAPTGLHTTSVTDKTVTLAWTKPSSAVGYAVYHINDSGSATRIAAIDNANTTHYTVSAIPEGGSPLEAFTTYKFAVTAGHIIGGNLVESGYSNIVEINTTHTWSGALQTCINASLGNGDPTHIPTKYELESITNFHCSNHRDLTDIEPVRDLKNLSMMFLVNNAISGPIPTWIGEMNNLNYIFLDGNELNGSLPDTLQNIAELRYLSAKNNRLSGSIPEWIVDFTKMEGLRLDQNRFSGTIPQEIWKLRGYLISLTLSDNNLSGTVPLQLGNLIGLNKLYLDGNNFSGSIANTVSHLAQLKDLRLQNNDFNGTITEIIENLRRLTHLDLSNNRFSGTIPPQIGNLSNLSYLNLGRNRLVGSIPSEIGNLEDNLTELYLNDNNLSGIIPPQIVDLVNLDSLYLAGNCNLFSDDEAVRTFIDGVEDGDSYQDIVDSNSHVCRENVTLPAVLLFLFD